MTWKKIIILFNLLFFLLAYPVFTEAENNKTGKPGAALSNNNQALILPDTGQTISYTDTFGEDSNYTINTASYTDNGNGAVTDNVTGIMWQMTDDNMARTWDNAAVYCDDLTLADHSDWRLPEILELVTIVNSGEYKPSLDTTYFHDAKPTEYWSSTTDALHSDLAWNVNFNYGEIYHYNKSNKYYARCARGDSNLNSKDKNYTDNSNGTVTDNFTRLMWQQKEYTETYGIKWEEALNYCENLPLAGYNDWRLPNYKELASLVDFGKYNPAIDTTYFPNVGRYSFAGFYLTSTTSAGNSYHSWIVHFAYGQMLYCNKSTKFVVRCVRGE